MTPRQDSFNQSRPRGRKMPAPSAQDIDRFVAAAHDGNVTAVADFVAAFDKRYMDAKNTHGDTALTRAARANQIEVVHLLLEKGAKSDALNSHRGTALMDAAVGGHVEVIKELLAHGADVTKKSYAHKTAQWYAEVNHHAEAATLIADVPRLRAEEVERITTETAGSLTGGIEKPLVVTKPLRFAAPK
jgi:ankyrin repeat protein